MHGGKHYRKAILQVNWQIKLTLKEGYYDFDEKFLIIPNEIKFCSDGLTSEFDHTLGTFTWSTYKPSCEDKLESIMGKFLKYNGF